jgi:hypothetical protein
MGQGSTPPPTRGPRPSEGGTSRTARLSPSLALSPAELFVAEVVAELDGGDTAAAKRVRRLLQRLVDWSVGEGMALDREIILDPDTVDRFVEVGLAADRSQATYRSILRKIGPLLTTTAPWTPRPVAVRRRTLAPPYGDEEIELLIGDGAHQPTPHRRKAARALLTLGLGAGLDGRWVTKIGAGDVGRRGPVVVVRVGEPMARAVVVRARWEQDLLDLARTAGDEFLVGGRSESRNRTGHLVASLEVPTGHPQLAPARLRSTWLLAHLQQGTRLPELCQIAGIQSPAVLSELLDHVLPMAVEDRDAMLRGGQR